MRSTFSTVPYYRSLWALAGRTEPVVVPGRTGGATEGATAVDHARRLLIDLVPLAGGDAEPDPTRGLGAVLAFSIGLTAGDLVVVLDPSARHAPADLPSGARGCLLRVTDLAESPPAALTELTNAARRGGRVVVVGSDKELAALDAAVPSDVAALLTRVPSRDLDQLDGGPYGVLHDATLGYLAAFADCGRWHLDDAVHTRHTAAGVAFTLLRQRSPRLVDILLPASDQVETGRCPRHGTAVIGSADR